MKGIVQRNLPTVKNRRAFTIMELVLVIVVLGILLGMHLPLYTRLRERSYVVIDQNNIRQILHASGIYAAENNDHLAHPTWGADLTGPDGWVYLTSQKSRPVLGALSATPQSCANRDIDSPEFTNQLAFFKVGQVTQYVPDVKTAWCPKDVATRGSGRLKQLWLSRPVKVTSYCWNGTVGGYVGPIGSLPQDGRTFKVSQFLPGDWQMWEINENDPFYFNDAASNPTALGEQFSFRHSGLTRWWTFPIRDMRKIPGGGIVGTFDGSVKLMNFQRAYDMAAGRLQFPNELLNGPRYQR